MLDLEIQPERSLGSSYWEFVLGMPLFQAIALIKSLDSDIKSVEFLYNEQDVLSDDLVICLTHDCIRLIFDSMTERLKIIEVYDMSKLKLRYCNDYFNSPTVHPTIIQIDHCFGATHPAKYTDDKSTFFLSFRGLTFQFSSNIDSKYQTIHVEKFGSVDFPSPASPLVSNLFIYSGTSFDNAQVPEMPSCCMLGGSYLQKLQLLKLQANSPFTFRFYIISDVMTTGDTGLNVVVRDVNFGDSCQDVQSLIGSPSGMYFKNEDKMRIHSARGSKQLHQLASDYFFNYTNYGMDILFDARTHQVKKVIMHTNFPNHFNFNLYYRCNFLIPLPVPSKSQDNQSLIGIDNDVIDLTFDTKWSSIERHLIKPTTRPVILNRTSENNPFGSTYCFGYKEFIFEVMPSDQMASVSLYHPSNKQILTTIDSKCHKHLPSNLPVTKHKNKSQRS